jgi:hypothetical protein
VRVHSNSNSDSNSNNDEKDIDSNVTHSENNNEVHVKDKDVSVSEQMHSVTDSSDDNDNEPIRVGTYVRLSNQYVNGLLWGSCDNAVFEKDILLRNHELLRLREENSTSSGLSSGATSGATGTGSGTGTGISDVLGSLLQGENNGRKSNVDTKSDTSNHHQQSLFYNKPPEFCLNDSTASLSPKSIFVIERASCLLGGEVRWDGSYRLRHLISNCYLSVKQTSSDNYEFYLSSYTKLSMRRTMISYEDKLRHVASSLFQFEPMVHEEAAGTCVTAKNSTVRLLHRFIEVSSTSELACRQQLHNLLQGGVIEFLARAPVALILGVQRPRTPKFCTSVMGSEPAALPRKSHHRTVMHKVSLFFSKQFSESDIFDIRPVFGQTKLLKDVHMMKLIHLVLDNFEAALCMFISANGANRASISEDTCMETLAALTTISKFVRSGSQVEAADDYPSFQNIQEKRANQVLCAKLGIIDRLFCIMSIPMVMGGTKKTFHY